MSTKQSSKPFSHLDYLQQQSEAEGYQCVVGAMIIRKIIGNENMSEDRVYVQKRSANRELFPDCWDILGGHVDAGESLETALAREIKEESGWELATIVKHLKTVHWQNAENETIREFVFLVTVNGDLDKPELETDKFSEYRWLSEDELDILKENRSDGEQLIFELASLALKDNLSDTSTNIG